jgi:hypothetical protein
MLGVHLVLVTLHVRLIIRKYNKMDLGSFIVDVIQGPLFSKSVEWVYPVRFYS